MLTSADEFLRLVESEDAEARQRVRHDTAPESVWMEIIEKHPDLRRSVTLNKTLPEAVLLALASDSDPAVRMDIANVRRLPREAFEMLARDADEQVRARLSWNKKTPRDILEALSRDASPLVAEPARERLGE